MLHPPNVIKKQVESMPKFQGYPRWNAPPLALKISHVTATNRSSSVPPLDLEEATEIEQGTWNITSRPLSSLRI